MGVAEAPEGFDLFGWEGARFGNVEVGGESLEAFGGVVRMGSISGGGVFLNFLICVIVASRK